MNESLKQESEGAITQLLENIRLGKSEARDELWSIVYRRLRELAHGRMKNEAHIDLMGTTALVHETYLKLTSADLEQIQNRHHFYAISARAMRRILVDRARKRGAEKRDTERKVDVEIRTGSDVIALHHALEDMAEVSPRLAMVVECRFFGGFNYEQIADALAVSVTTVERDWRRAKAHLKFALTQ